MSDISTSSMDRIPQPIRDRIRALRQKLFRNLVIDGIGRVIFVVLGLFLLDLLIDRSFRLDVPQRVVMLMIVVAGFLWALWYWLLSPLQRVPTDDALAHEIERQHPEKQQAILTAMQLARYGDLERLGVSKSLMTAAIELGAREAESVDVNKVFNSTRIKQGYAIFGAAVLLLVVGGVATAQTDFLNTWFNRNLMLGTKEWPKETYLIVEGLNERGKLPVIRGEDCRLLVSVDDRSKKKDVDAFVTSRDQGGEYEQLMRRLNADSRVQFEHVFANVTSGFEFRVRGGDDVTGWIDIEIMEPPGLEGLTIVAVPPAYTGLSPAPLDLNKTPFEILKGSKLEVFGKPNTKLGKAVVRTPNKDISFDLSNSDKILASVPAEELLEGKYVLSFADASGVASKKQTSFVVKLLEDTAPKVRASTSGVTTMIVSRARIPLKATLTDDFAVTKAAITHTWKGESSDSVPQTGTHELTISDEQKGAKSADLMEAWSIESLKIPTGVTLRFTVDATDNYGLGDPQVGSSKEFLFRVVSDQELLADLARREVEQRNELERAMKNQDDLLTETKALLADMESTELTAEQILAEIASRTGKLRQQERTVGTTLGQVAQRYLDFRTETDNNQLDDENGTLKTRLKKIADLLADLDQTDIDDTSRLFEAARREPENKENVKQVLTESLQSQQEIIDKIKEILKLIAQAEDFQRIVTLLREVEKSQKTIQDSTEKEKAERIERALKKNQPEPMK